MGNKVRRDDKEIASRSEIDDIIRGCKVCHLGLAVDGEPYIVPVSFGYDGEAVYFHTAPEGKKIDFIGSMAGQNTGIRNTPASSRGRPNPSWRLGRKSRSLRTTGLCAASSAV